MKSLVTKPVFIAAVIDDFYPYTCDKVNIQYSWPFMLINFSSVVI